MPLTLKDEIAIAVTRLAEEQGWGMVIGQVTPQIEVSLKTNGSVTLLVETPEGEKSVLVSRSLRAEIVNQ